MITSIGVNHLEQLKQAEHVLTWLQGERARVEQEMVTVAQQWQREESKLRSFLAQVYGIQGPFTLDTDAGHIVTPDPDPIPAPPEPEEEPARAD